MKRSHIACVSLVERASVGVRLRRVANSRLRTGWLPPRPSESIARAALDVGALDDLLHSFPDEYETSDPSDAVLFARALIGTGRDDEARSWSHVHGRTLARTAEGIGILSVLGERTPTWAGRHQPNFVGLEARLADGADPFEILSSLTARPWVWFTNPETHLFAYNALRKDHPDRAARFLNRYAEAFRLPAFRLSSAEPGGVEFDAPRKVRGPDKVTIVVSVYNASTTVAGALMSLVNQSYLPTEILVCDDASSDDSLDIIVKTLRSVPGARVFRSAKNQGPYNIRNHLINEAIGDVITFHDSDDLALPTRISHQLAALRRMGAEACIARWLRVRPDGKVVFFPDQSASRLSMVSLMIDRAAVRRLGPFRNAAFGADLEYFEDIRRGGRTCYSRYPMIWSSWVEGSLTRASGSAALESGYRSPSRRAYSSLVLRKRLEQVDIGEDLKRLGILRPPSVVREIKLR